MTESLREYAETSRQREVLDAIKKHGSQNLAATSLGISRRNVERTVQRIKAVASTRGWSPEHDWTHPVPETHVAKGVSTYFEKTDTSPAAWVKADLRQQAYNEAVKGAISEFLEDVAPITCAPAPLDVQGDIIPWLQIGDAHLGMLAHVSETNENFDLKIAERELCMAICMLIDELPPCERIVINDLGDFTHYSNYKGETNKSGHRLDYDGRYPKMIQTYSRVMRYIIDKCLTKCQHLDIIINPGNHSEENDVWMAELLRVGYGHTGRVHVLNNDNIFIGYRMGNTLVMTNHSDRCPPARLIGVMTSDFRKDFGETEFHYIDVGHVHHHFVSKEHPSVVIESWNHLAANDKWAHDSGYRSRKAISIVWRSKTYGDMGRRVLPVEQIKARLIALGKNNAPATRETYTV